MVNIVSYLCHRIGDFFFLSQCVNDEKPALEELMEMPLAGNTVNLLYSKRNVGWLQSGELEVE